MAKFNRDYKNFDAREFIGLSYAEGSPKERFLELMHAELEKHGQKGGKLLELGTGPAVHTSLLASKYYNDIILCEYSEPNREELKKWVKQEDAYDWSHYVNLISKMEHSEPKLIEKRTRTSIKEIIPCDLTKDTPVPPYTGACFECIVSSLTLECSYIDMESYEIGLKKVFDLLVPGGLFIFMVVFGQSYYVIGNITYPILNLKPKDTDDALKKAGFSEIDFVPIKNTFKVPGDKKDAGYYKAVKPIVVN